MNLAAGSLVVEAAHFLPVMPQLKLAMLLYMVVPILLHYRMYTYATACWSRTTACQAPHQSLLFCINTQTLNMLHRPAAAYHLPGDPPQESDWSQAG
jgi:hypothetical protein